MFLITSLIQTNTLLNAVTWNESCVLQFIITKRFGTCSFGRYEMIYRNVKFKRHQINYIVLGKGNIFKGGKFTLENTDAIFGGKFPSFLNPSEPVCATQKKNVLTL
jgi:hypothetical protein